MNIKALQSALETIEGVVSVHDVHVWTIASNRDALTAHVVVEAEAFTPSDFIEALQHALSEMSINIPHMTMQLETEAFEQTHDDGFYLPAARS